jgi:hypothetical protein
VDADGWNAWEMAVNVGFAEALRTQGAANDEWQALLAAARRELKYFKATLPPRPAGSGENEPDLPAIIKWLATTLPEAMQVAVPSGIGVDMEKALEPALLNLCRASRAAETAKMLADLKQEDLAAGEPWMIPALKSDLDADTFHRLMLCHASRFSTGPEGFEDDPLRSAIEAALGNNSFGADSGEKAFFDNRASAALATALESARNAPGWLMRLEAIGDDVCLLDADFTLSGKSGLASFKTAEDLSVHLVVIGADTWTSLDERATWRKNAGGKYERFFKTLIGMLLQPQWAEKNWLVHGMGAGYGSVDAPNVSPTGHGVIYMKDGKPVFGYHVLATRALKPEGQPEHEFCVTKTATGAWRLCEFAHLTLHPAPDAATSITRVKATDMTQLGEKPEINAPVTHGLPNANPKRKP